MSESVRVCVFACHPAYVCGAVVFKVVAVVVVVTVVEVVVDVLVAAVVAVVLVVVVGEHHQKLAPSPPPSPHNHTIHTLTASKYQI